MPNMEDPEVLQLVLCLLEVDSGDQFSSLGVKCTEKLKDEVIVNQWEGAIIPAGTNFNHSGTNFTSSWLTVPSAVDKLFTPVLLNLKFECNETITTKQLQLTSGGAFETNFKKLLPEMFHHFNNLGHYYGTNYYDSDNNNDEYNDINNKNKNQDEYSMDIINNTQKIPLVPPSPSQSRTSSSDRLNRNTILIKKEFAENKIKLHAIEPIKPSSIQFPKIHGHDDNKNLPPGLQISNGGRGIPDDTLLTLKTSFNKEQNKKLIAENKAKKLHDNPLYPNTSGLNYTSTDYNNIPISMLSPNSPQAKNRTLSKQTNNHISNESNLLSVGGKNHTSYDQLLLGKSLHDSFPTKSNHSGSSAPRLITTSENNEITSTTSSPSFSRSSKRF